MIVELGTGQLLIADEWHTVQAQAARDAANKRHGLASVKSDLGIANANGTVSGWMYSSAQRYSLASVQWAAAAFNVSGFPVGGQAYGPIRNATAAALAPWSFGITTAPGNLRLYDTAGNTLATGSALATASWEILLTEWDWNNNRVRGWIWNAGTGKFDLSIDYTHGSTLGPRMQVVWGWSNPKAGGLGITANTMDMLWIDNAGGWPNRRPVGPPWCYPGYPVGNGTHTAWTGAFGDVDDWAAGGANDGDTTKINSGVGPAEVKESCDFTNGLVAGNAPVVGLGFGGRDRIASGTGGGVRHLVVADGAEYEEDVNIENGAYFNNATFRPLTPAGNPWTSALADGLEYGRVRQADGDPQDAYCTALVVAVAECELEPPGAGATTLGLSPGAF